MTCDNIDFSISNKSSSSDKLILKDDINKMLNNIENNKIININNLVKYSELLNELENQKRKFENETLSELQSLVKFGESSEQLTELIDIMIIRFNNLNQFDSSKFLTLIHQQLTKIEKFSSSSNKLLSILDNLSSQDFFSSYQTANSTVNIFSKISSELSSNNSSIPDLIVSSNNSLPDVDNIHIDIIKRNLNKPPLMTEIINHPNNDDNNDNDDNNELPTNINYLYLALIIIFGVIVCILLLYLFSRK